MLWTDLNVLVSLRLLKKSLWQIKLLQYMYVNNIKRRINIKTVESYIK